MERNEALDKYEEWHKRYNKDVLNKDILNLMTWHKMVLDFIPEDLSGIKILEAGCGNGDFSNYLSLNRNATITGLDFSTESIKIANEKKQLFGASTTDFIVGDAQNLPFKDQSFDLVVSCECLEHVPDPQKMINELYRVLKPGGKVVLTTENYSNAYAYYRLFLKLRGKPFNSGAGLQPIENFFVYWRVAKKFRNAGFNKVNTYSKEYVMLLLPGMHPNTFTIKETHNPLFRRLLKPFGRRMAYVAVKS